jgi:hypothetical protein
MLFFFFDINKPMPFNNLLLYLKINKSDLGYSHNFYSRFILIKKNNT